MQIGQASGYQPKQNGNFPPAELLGINIRGEINSRLKLMEGLTMRMLQVTLTDSIKPLLLEVSLPA